MPDRLITRRKLLVSNHRGLDAAEAVPRQIWF